MSTPSISYLSEVSSGRKAARRVVPSQMLGAVLLALSSRPAKGKRQGNETYTHLPSATSTVISPNKPAILYRNFWLVTSPRSHRISIQTSPPSSSPNTLGNFRDSLPDCWRFTLSGCPESNWVYLLPKQAYYRYTTPRQLF